ncbi:hypothetical protein F511_21765 [Dorcoceras hygrometricum]|uniref:Uncharacterized protein n=1 Tax=Dorcoceras hygrometricum TaxID=472368 RepID=A0A2Z7A9Y3_9LAMI|nr:hypothetical protein F511_21765 [Dorcoceras hygrometricum]
MRDRPETTLEIKKQPSKIRPKTSHGGASPPAQRQHAACAPVRNACARGRPPARTARASGAEVGARCRAAPCSTCAHGCRSACAVACATGAHPLPHAGRTLANGGAERCARRCWAKKLFAPGFDQFHEEIGTSTVGGWRSPNPVHGTRKRDESFTDGISSSRWSEQVQPRQAAAHSGGGARRAAREGGRGEGGGGYSLGFCESCCVGNVAIGITDSACKNQSVMVSVQYGPFNTYIPIRSTTIGKSRVARDPITMHTSWRSNSDIACVTSIGYPRTKASGESSTTKHRLLHESGPHPIPPPDDPN